MKHKLLSLLISLILILGSIGAVISFPMAVSATGNTYYVATTGSDSANGSLATPWLTINHAAATAMAGDTVEVETGTYNEHVVPQNSGSSSNPITFENYPGESPIIDGIGVANGYALFQFSQVSYVNISGFQIQNGSGAAIFVQGSSDINISNITIDNCVGAGIDASPDWNQNPSTYLTINNCTIYNTNTGNDLECLTLMSVNQFEINDCTIHDSTKEGIDCSIGCTNGSIHNCTVYNVKEGIYVDPEQTAESNISIYDNLVYNTPDNGIILSSELNGTQQSMTGISIYNNILYGNAVGFSVGSISVPANTFSFTFINNTIYNNSYGGITLGNASYILSGIVRNNIIVGTSGNILTSLSGSGSQVVIDHNLFYNPGGYNASNIYGTNYIQADPLFNNPPTDFSLQSGSPAINAGSATAAPATDYIGTSRPQGAAWDIGAYEYIAPVVTISAATSVTSSSSVLNGNITVAGGNNPTVTIYWGTSDGGNTAGNWANSVSPTSPAQPQGVAAFYYNLTGLTAGRTYYYNAFAINTAGGSWAGTSQHFTTSSAGVATVTISAATVILANFATLNGNVTAIGGANPTVTVYYGTADGGNVAGNWQNHLAPTSPVQPQGVSAFYLNISGLTASTKYYFNAAVANSGGTAWAGTSLNFTTNTAPDVSFFQNITLTETGATAFAYLPMGVAFNTSSIISSGYMAANGLDSSVYDNGMALPTMFTNSSILFVDSLDPTGSSGSTITDVLKTGQTPKSSMPIIVGNNGYVTTADNDALEPANNFSIVANGYLNTTAGASENIVSKSGALSVYVDPTISGTLDATVSESINYTNPTFQAGSGSAWTTPANAFDGNLTTFAQATNVSGALNNYVIGTNTAFMANQIQYKDYASMSDPTYASVQISVNISGTWTSVVNSTSNLNGTYTTNLPNFPALSSCTGIKFNFTDTSSYYGDIYDMYDIGYVLQPFISVSGISSGAHTITCSETTAAGGTLSLQVDSGTPSTITGVGSVPINTNNWIIDQNNVMPYMTSYTYTVGGTELIKYQPATIIAGTALVNLDSSGAYPGAITFGTNNAAVTVALSGSFGPLTPASYNSSNNYGPQTPSSIDLGNPIQPPTMYTGLTTDKFPFGTAIDAILDAGQVPHALFWYPFIFLFIVIVSMLGYDATQSTGGQGSLLTQCIIAEVLLVIFGVLGDVGVSSLIPLWPAFLFPLPAVAMIMSRRHVGWG